MELGIYSFAENTADPVSGKTLPAAVRIQNLLEEIRLADEVGLDVFGIGEHHRSEYLASAPAVILAAAAAQTKRIRLTSAVSVLSSDDPVRVFQAFASLDLLSEGRAEIMAGRGSFIESFPLFGYDLADYNSLFTEKLELLLALCQQERITWTGRHRTPMVDLGIFPRPVQQPLPVWIAVGGTPQSIQRAATLGLPLALAIIGGQPARFAPLVDLYRDSARTAGRDPGALPVSINSHGFIADTSQAALDLCFPAFSATMARIGRERGWAPMGKAQFESECGPKGAHFVGSPNAVVDKILYEHELFGHQRTLIQLSVGTLPHKDMLRAIELFGTRVAPAVKKALRVESDPVRDSRPSAPTS